MRTISVFNNVSLDGFISDSQGDMSWAHKQDPEWTSFVANNAKGDCEFLFGRVTYELMASFWPTAFALENMPAVATRMNSLPKLIFSRTLKAVSWNNSSLVKGDLVKATRKIKSSDGSDIVIFGSGSIISQLAQVGLIDKFQLVVHPIVLGGGKTMFGNLKKALGLKLTSTRAFSNGCVLLDYIPA